MPLNHVQNWDNAYANGINIAGGDAWPGLWIDSAKRFRDSIEAQSLTKFDLRYGNHPRNVFDLFYPVDAPLGLVVFIHGGFWLKTDKSYWSHLAAGPLAHGYAVAMPSYTLCPEIRVSGICREIGAAIEAAARIIAGPIRLTGYSAGGHLATRMITTDPILSPAVQARVVNTVSISGLHDLRPLIYTGMNAQLKIDEAEARAESPALLQPMKNAKLTCWVGGAERAEFRRQSALLANIWTGLRAMTETVEEPDKHHFSVIEGLSQPDHPLTRTLMA